MLAELCSTGKVKIVASLDHIKSGSLFSDQILDQLNAVWLQMDTYQDLQHEMLSTPDLFAAEEDKYETGWQYIFKAMTDHQRRIV